MSTIRDLQILEQLYIHIYPCKLYKKCRCIIIIIQTQGGACVEALIVKITTYTNCCVKLYKLEHTYTS